MVDKEANLTMCDDYLRSGDTHAIKVEDGLATAAGIRDNNCMTDAGATRWQTLGASKCTSPNHPWSI
jgi:hypothetical protein